MIIPILLFSLAALVISGILVAVAFHVTRYRYHNDASLYIFVSICVIYVLITILTFTFFRYSDGSTTNSNRHNQLLTPGQL